MGLWILASDGLRAEQIETPIVGEIPPIGIQRIDQRREQPMYRRSVSLSSPRWGRGNTPEAKELMFPMPRFAASLTASLDDKF